MHTNRTRPSHRSRRSTLLLSIASITGLTLVATGCGKSPSEFVAEKVIEQQTDGQVDVDFGDGNIAVETPDGNVTIGDDGTFTVTDGNGETITGSGDADGNVTVEGDDGTFTMSQGGEIPGEWPADVPQPQGIEVSGSSVMDTGDGNGITLSGVVGDGPAFMAEYGSSLEAAGLAKASEYSTAEVMSAMYGNESWSMSIGSSQFDGQHQISITLYPFSG
jgi:hypothetical protein